LLARCSGGEHPTKSLSKHYTSFMLLLRRPFESTQYASGACCEALSRLAAVQSMSRKGECWDNAVLESFFSTLKLELNLDKAQGTRQQTRTLVFEWIEAFYNRERHHSSLGYLSPHAFEERWARLN